MTFLKIIKVKIRNMNNLCFEGFTPIVYKKTLDEDCKIDVLENLYKKFNTEEFYVYVHTLLENEITQSQGFWKKCRLCYTESIQETEIYIIPDEIINLESNNVIRVTPNHRFPIFAYDNQIKFEEAYLLQTGDRLMFDVGRISEDDVENESINLDNIFVDGAKHSINYRKIYKTETLDIDKKVFYGVCFVDDDNKDDCFVLYNGLISRGSNI